MGSLDGPVTWRLKEDLEDVFLEGVFFVCGPGVRGYFQFELERSDTHLGVMQRPHPKDFVQLDEPTPYISHLRLPYLEC
jgi:hypothetical protein